MRVRFTARAARQLDGILADLSKINPSAAKALLARVNEITMQLAQFPSGFQEVGDRPTVRRAPMIRFPYLIFYKILTDEVIVMRIRHGARKEPWENL